MFDWLFSEAGIAWIVAIGALIGFMYSLLRQDRPTIVVIQELETIELLNIHSSQRKNVVIQYIDNGSPYEIRNLVQQKFVVYNSGTHDITESITFTVPVTSVNNEQNNGVEGFIKVISDSSQFSAKPIRDIDNKVKQLEMSLAYINSAHKHKSYIEAYFLSEELFDFGSKNISGKGWSVQVAKRKRLKRLGIVSDLLFTSTMLIVWLGIFLALVLAVAFLSIYLQNQFSIARDSPIIGLLAIIALLLSFYIGGYIQGRTRIWGTRFIADKISMSILNYPPLPAIEEVVLPK